MNVVTHFLFEDDSDGEPRITSLISLSLIAITGKQMATWLRDNTLSGLVKPIMLLSSILFVSKKIGRSLKTKRC